MITFKEILGTIPTPKDIGSTIKSHFNSLHECGNTLAKLALLYLAFRIEYYICNTYIFTPVIADISTAFAVWHVDMSLYFGLGVILFSFPHLYKDMKIKPYLRPLAILGFFIGLSILFYYVVEGYDIICDSIENILKPLDDFIYQPVLELTTILLSYIIICATLGLIFKLLRFQSPKKVIATIITLALYLSVFIFGVILWY